MSLILGISLQGTAANRFPSLFFPLYNKVSADSDTHRGESEALYYIRAGKGTA